MFHKAIDISFLSSLLCIDVQMDGRMDRRSGWTDANMSEEVRCRLARRDAGSICRRVWGSATASVNKDLPWHCQWAKRGGVSASGSPNSQMVKMLPPLKNLHSTEIMSSFRGGLHQPLNAGSLEAFCFNLKYCKKQNKKKLYLRTDTDSNNSNLSFMCWSPVFC